MASAAGSPEPLPVPLAASFFAKRVHSPSPPLLPVAERHPGEGGGGGGLAPPLPPVAERHPDEGGGGLATSGMLPEPLPVAERHPGSGGDGPELALYIGAPCTAPTGSGPGSTGAAFGAALPFGGIATGKEGRLQTSLEPSLLYEQDVMTNNGYEDETNHG